MKNRFLWIGIIAVMILGLVHLISCDDYLHDTVQFVGTVVYMGTTDPLSDIPVKITDGKKTHCQSRTDSLGKFKLPVRINDINGQYYLLAGDSTCIPEEVYLGGFGRDEVDLGVIEVEGPALAVVETGDVSNVAFSSALCKGNVILDGMPPIKKRGICWSKSQVPTINDSCSFDGIGTGEFQTTITNLEPNTTYYARAYATNVRGTAYGRQVSFTTTTGKPTVDIYNEKITSTTAKWHVIVSDNGGFDVTRLGICWNTEGSPKANNENANDSIRELGKGTGTFEVEITSLTPDKNYYLCAFAENEKGIAYSEPQFEFKTPNGKPIVHTATYTRLNGNIIITGGEVISESPVRERGICYNTAPEPDTNCTKQIDKTPGESSFTINFNVQDIRGRIYFRAYAINAMGVGYGEEWWYSPEYEHLPTFQYNGKTYKVGASTNTTYTWSEANEHCKGYTLGGYNDWRLPTKGELIHMYEKRDYIGDFKRGGYWSSTDDNYGWKCVVFFDGTNNAWTNPANSFYVRPIRVHQ